MRLIARAAALAVAFLSVSAMTPSSAGAATLDYVSLGDSYAAGVGAGDYSPDSGSCLRSDNSYPSLIAANLGARSTLRSCSGAATTDIPDQAAVLSSDVELVTVQVGGNDVGFTSTLATCKLGDDTQCTQAVTSAIGFMQTQLSARLDAAYRDVRSKAPNARVLVVGYPHLFTAGDCANEMSEHKRGWLNTASDYLNAITQNRAVAAGFTFVDVRTAFTGHGVCAADAWINGLRDPLVESYHPNRDGQLHGFSPALRAAL